MEKTIFLFTRKATRSRKDFGKHYIGNHAPLGRRLTRGLLGYTVNLVQNRDWPDALTEHWVHAAMDLLTPSIAYAQQQDFEEVLTDDISLFDGFRLYVVTAEFLIVSGELLDSPLGELTPECKAVWTFHDASALPQAPRKARRVVDNFVSYELVHTGNGKWEKRAADVAVFRMAWTSGPDGPNDECMIVDEYRQIPCPPPGWSADRDA